MTPPSSSQTTEHTMEAKPPTVDPNYQYWRDHGGEWGPEYEARKRRLVLYHIQELMLTTYVAAHAAIFAASGRRFRVLEFGCGPGRHLRNLSAIANADVFGFDQSRAMAEGCLRWADREWFDTHVAVGAPTGPLPFDDGSFDLVYSAEVLVHVRPEHLEDRLLQMIRVCRGHVLHIEPSPEVRVDPACHGGCWNHDLPEAYRRLGRACEVLPRGYLVHTPFRVTVDEEPAYTWPSQVLAIYRQLEADVDAGLAAADRAAADAAALAKLRMRVAELEAGARAEAERSRAALATATESARKAAEKAAAQAAVLAAREGELAQVRMAMEVQRKGMESLRGQILAGARALEATRAEMVRREREVRAALTEDLARAMERGAELERRLAAAGTALAAARSQYESLRSKIV